MDTKSDNTEATRKPQMEQKHPDAWQRDLNPDHMRGQNIGVHSAEPEIGIRTAHELKGVHRALDDIPDDDLKQIPILREGARLQQGSTYMDLADADRREFTATGDIEVEAEHLYVPKARIPYQLWNRLRGEREA